MWSFITAITVGYITDNAGYGLLAFLVMAVFEQMCDHLRTIRNTMERK